LSTSSAAALALLLAAAMPAARSEPSAARAAALVHLVRQDCGACHGLTLQGGLGPALTPAALRDKDAGSLVATVVHGRPGTPMPPFKGLLEESEAQWIVAKLMTAFPEEAK